MPPAGIEDMRDCILDTNCVLDWLLFDDPRARIMQQHWQLGRYRWIAQPAMRDELQRVLSYPAIASQLQARNILAQEILQLFDRRCVEVKAALPAAVRCQDADDQMFVDLAVARQAVLFSRDKAILALTSRLRQQGVDVLTW